MSRFRVVVAVLSSWVMVGVLATVAPASAQAAAVTMPGGFTSLAPTRLLDTRAHVGVPTTTPVAAGGTVHLQVAGAGGVPATGVSAVVLNVTVTGPSAAGYVTVYGDQASRPTVSNLNFSRGQTVPNLVIAPVGDNGKVALYNGSAGTTHLIADVAGYYLDDTIRAITVSAGGAHSCALTTAGAVKCWGVNNNGELGIGTTTSSAVPVSVSGLGSGVVAISAGGNHTCAVTSTGALKCWGYNYFGEVGDGTNVNALVPVDVVGLGSGVAAVSADGQHTCALTSTGAIKCWGQNGAGQLGNNTYTWSSVPVDVSGLGSGIAAADAGGGHSCAVTSTGAVKCWGFNLYGRLGDGTTTDSPVPVNVSGFGSGGLGVSAGGTFTCALTTAGTVKCWGHNAFGQLGDGTTTDALVPVNVSGLGSGAVTVDAGNDHSCVRTSAGAVKCWGYNLYGQLGNGGGDPSTVPVGVVGLGSGTVAASAGSAHSCAATSTGAVKCWGRNDSGQLGNGTTTNSSVPVSVVGLG